MCILFIYRNPNADAKSYRLIVASNRDEMYRRPAEPAHYWPNHPNCLGGTDEEPGREGGTWLAMSRSTGKAGVILNLTGEKRQNTEAGKGRGNLVVDFIASNNSAENYLSNLHDVNQKDQPYNPFSLVLLDMHDASVRYLTSSQDSAGPLVCENSILGFGNSLIEQPYEKVRAGKAEFGKIVSGACVSERDRLIADIRQLLKSKEQHLPDPELERRSPNWYKSLSSIFVQDEHMGYGTRTHSIILVDGANTLTFVEDTRLPHENSWGTSRFETNLDKKM